MTTTQQLTDLSVVAEDLIRSLESVIHQAELGTVIRPAREIAAESPELFRLNYGVIMARRAALDAKARLLAALGLPPDTQFTTASL